MIIKVTQLPFINLSMENLLSNLSAESYPLKKDEPNQSMKISARRNCNFDLLEDADETKLMMCVSHLILHPQRRMEPKAKFEV